MFSWLFFWRNTNPHVFAFDFAIFLLHIFYIAVFFNIAIINQSFVDYYGIAIQVFIVSFLLYRFRKHRPIISSIDSKIIRYSAYFILLNVVLVEITRRFEFLKQFLPESWLKYFANIIFSK